MAKLYGALLPLDLIGRLGCTSVMACSSRFTAVHQGWLPIQQIDQRTGIQKGNHSALFTCRPLSVELVQRLLVLAAMAGFLCSAAPAATQRPPPVKWTSLPWRTAARPTSASGAVIRAKKPPACPFKPSCSLPAGGSGNGSHGGSDADRPAEEYGWHALADP